MKIQIVSDLHMEFSPASAIKNAGADILVLAGDIVVAERFKRNESSPFYTQSREWLGWFEATCADFDRVIYILGNHEHYHGRFNETYDTLVAALARIQNLTILDNEYWDYRDVRFFGTTLWTNFDNDNFKAMLGRDSMNDYKLIEGQFYRKLTPTDTMVYHQNAVRSIVEQSYTGRKLVVCGHHLPSYSSIHPDYYGSPLNSAYASHLDRIIEASPSVALWIHGHTHRSCDYEIGDTRIICNPRGYPLKQGYENPDFNHNLVVEI